MKQLKSKGKKKRKNQSLNSRDGIQKINYILSKFNFENVAIAMKAVEWRYCDIAKEEYYYPNPVQLKEKAHLPLSLVAFEKENSVTSGGFVANRYKNGDLHLYFCLEEATTEFYNPKEVNCR